MRKSIHLMGVLATAMLLVTSCTKAKEEAPAAQPVAVEQPAAAPEVAPAPEAAPAEQPSGEQKAQ